MLTRFSRQLQEGSYRAKLQSDVSYMYWNDGGKPGINQGRREEKGVKKANSTDVGSILKADLNNG